MTILLSSGAANIAVPFPQAILAVKSNVVQTTSNLVLPLPANDGTTISLSNAAVLTINNLAGGAVYTINPTAINAAVTFIAGIFLDTVNGVIWVLGTNASAGHGYLATVNYLTGTVTAIGSGFTGPTNTLASSLAGPLQTERASIGSGDLTFWNGTYNFSLSTTTGLVTVAESHLLLNGAGLLSTTANKWYSTLDKTIFVQFTLNNSSYLSTSGNSIVIFRNGRTMTITFDTSAVGGMPGGSGYPWGVNQVWVAPFASNGLPNGVQMFARNSFDAWLQNIANSAGMP